MKLFSWFSIALTKLRYLKIFFRNVLAHLWTFILLDMFYSTHNFGITFNIYRKMWRLIVLKEAWRIKEKNVT